MLRTQNVSEQNQKHFLCPGHKICVRNKCCARGQTGKHLCRQQYVLVCQGLKVHLTPKIFFAKTIKLILWSNVPQKFFDLVKSSNFCAPLKLSFVWFTTEHGESGESKAVTSLRERKRRPFTLCERRSLFAA